MIKSPPPHDPNPFAELLERYSERLGEYLEHMSVLDKKGRYLHYDKMRFRVPPGLDPKLVWALVKQSRLGVLAPVIAIGAPPKTASLYLTPAINRAFTAVDQHTTTAMLQWMSKQIGEAKHVDYLLKDLIQDEAISSSQLEGAATTTIIAKDMLRRNRQPRTPDEKMILGNFRMMQCAWKSRHSKLTTELILDIHQAGVEGINDEKYHPGSFRVTDTVVVEDGEHNVLYTPPPAAGLESRLEKLAEWINQDHGAADSAIYFHPLIKAIVLHFMIGFEHPFHDGNGRVARSLFYWFMFKNGYDAFRYITISTPLKAAFSQYGKSYLYTESDDLDLTYFVDFQARIISKAVQQFKSAYEETARGIADFNNFIIESGLYKDLNEKQRIVLHVAKTETATHFTITNVQHNLGCSYNTAASALNGLVEQGLFRKNKEGREWVYSMVPAKDIIKNWKALQ